MSEINNLIKQQIDLLVEERNRAKLFINENGFDCTTAPWVIVFNYRNALKEHIEILRMNLRDE